MGLINFQQLADWCSHYIGVNFIHDFFSQSARNLSCRPRRFHNDVNVPFVQLIKLIDQLKQRVGSCPRPRMNELDLQPFQIGDVSLNLSQTGCGCQGCNLRRLRFLCTLWRARLRQRGWHCSARKQHHHHHRNNKEGFDQVFYHEFPSI